ncbi:hypothetical protein [Sphingomonas adhaesiva]|uniref:hypothetical protein n=1 Tax=Sphingomonas adhaesiva TaxID=28212 RepID=UPI002FF8A5A0
MALVDGVTTAPDSRGIVQGNGGAQDKVAGGSGNDRLQGNAAFNQMYGGEGNDTFILSAKGAYGAGAHQGQSSAFGDQFAYITDFGGAGGYSSTNNDFLALSGFGKASTLTLVDTHASGTPGALLLQYALTDSNTGAVFNILINSVNGKTLGQGDYAFY